VYSKEGDDVVKTTTTHTVDPVTGEVTATPTKEVVQAGNNGANPNSGSNTNNGDTTTPAEVPTTQPAEQPSQTVEVPSQLADKVETVDAQVAPSQNQAVLPNTGTKADRATGALGALSLLGAFGLLFAKKKKDNEEEA
ncbi:LPXTG cell wall anchor domain-containing protein, partial [Streptococcus pseudopneumoniae]|uniref:LPXTG cell wall anchor domain-containing protein n=1 Tax=Streptococcus pseudopneumoniae TaxID=257758 RepID=UPI00066E1CFF